MSSLGSKSAQVGPTTAEMRPRALVGAAPARVGAHTVVRLPPPVEAQHQRDTVLVQPRYRGIVQQDAVGGEGELELLPRLGLLPQARPRVSRHDPAPPM